MITPLTTDELYTMREAGKVAAIVLKKLEGFIRPGILTKDIEEFFVDNLNAYPGMEPAFKGFMGYPSSCCVSLNQEIIHGIPSSKVVRDGDIISVDLGIKYKGLYVDTAYTYAVGNVSSLAKKLLDITFKSLYEGISQIKIGSKVGDIGFAVQRFVEANNFSIIRKFVGHGIGKKLHVPPEIPNFGEMGEGCELKEGYALAVEPMVAVGSFDVTILDDGWTVKTKDDSLSAHFEHTIALTKNGPWILTS